MCKFKSCLVLILCVRRKQRGDTKSLRRFTMSPPSGCFELLCKRQKNAAVLDPRACDTLVLAAGGSVVWLVGSDGGFVSRRVFGRRHRRRFSACSESRVSEPLPLLRAHLPTGGAGGAPLIVAKGRKRGHWRSPSS